VKTLSTLRAIVALSLGLAGASRAGTLVQFRTQMGDLIVELYDQDKPVTVANFMRYVDAGRYTNMFLHRCVPGFVVQGGGYGVTNPASASPMQSYGVVPKYDPITNEFAVGPRYSNTYGTVAMAKSASGPDTATSEWFFNLADNSANLDNQNGGFTVFGRVILGTNVLEQFNARSMWDGIVDLGSAPFRELPVTYSGVFWPRYNELIYCDVQVLTVRLGTLPPGPPTLRWNSVYGFTNIIDYSDSISPSDWHPLVATNGTGSPLSIPDPSPSPTGRFYRIRVAK
jgi:cyclophilin family peptidyl-prolyl cis-trans isomerase